MTDKKTTPILEIRSLRIEVKVGRTNRVLVSSVDLTIAPGEAVGLVGESGSGKSLTARSVIRLLPENAATSGDVLVAGKSVMEMSPSQLRKVRSSVVGMIYQDPRAAMNPVRTIGDFLTEGLSDLAVDLRYETAAKALVEVGIDDAERRFRQYPHQLSGGLLQRVVIASALLPNPALILADEPTTALDVTSQSEVMAVLSDLQTHRGVGMLFITHDLDLAAAVTERIAVMYAGVVVETGPTPTMHERARHPYTVALMAARPKAAKVERLLTVPGRPISAFEAGCGCVFASRCPFVLEPCRTQRPELRPIGDHLVACHRAEELDGTVLDGLEVVT